MHGGRVAGVAVGSEGGLGGGGHARVPGGAPVGHDRLVGERVDVETRQHAAAALPAGTAGQHVGQHHRGTAHRYTPITEQPIQLYSYKLYFLQSQT